MPHIQYLVKRYKPETQAIIDIANEIIGEYLDDGFDLTVRQLYYQFVAHHGLENTETSYKRLSKIINNARLSGDIDWDAITDRTRELEHNSHWEDDQEILETIAKQFAIDKWADQPCRLEVWIEKDALASVAERACKVLDVPYFSCRGYVSQSEMWAAGRRFLEYSQDGQVPVIIYLGDHDPSGIDMTRDIEKRLSMFMESEDGGHHVTRLALNRDQIRKYKPPPNPAKITDPRAAKYIEQHGNKSWELDALDARRLTDLITTEIYNYRDDDLWQEACDREEVYRENLTKANERWPEVVKFLRRD